MELDKYKADYLKRGFPYIEYHAEVKIPSVVNNPALTNNRSNRLEEDLKGRRDDNNFLTGVRYSRKGDEFTIDLVVIQKPEEETTELTTSLRANIDALCYVHPTNFIRTLFDDHNYAFTEIKNIILSSGAKRSN